MASPWHISIDTGGTFTDMIARDPRGNTHRAKVLSSGWVRLRAPAQDQGRVDYFHAELPGTVDVGDWNVRLRRGSTITASGTVVSHDAASGAIHIRWDRPPELNQGNAPGEMTIELGTGEPAPVLAARMVTGARVGDPLPAMHLRLATTRGTNALLERAGAVVAFFVTSGFADLLLIGDQQRPDLFALDIRKRKPLHQHVVEVDERLNAEGSVLRPLNESALREAAADLVSRNVRVAAVTLLHSYRNDDHEQRVAAILREAGFTHISTSAALAPLIEILPRAETCVVDAYLGPIIASYLEQVREAMPVEGSRLHVMTSAGGLVEARRYHAKDSLLSGPAGGVAGAAAAGRASGFTHVIGFDMGGTSTDVARVDADFEYRFAHEVGGARLVAPALAIETVAAGGGSICDFVNERLMVGPTSAGADPGPACYGAGGPLTLTDVNVLMGRIDPEQFEVPIDTEASQRALEAVLGRIEAATGQRPERDDLLDGLHSIANERMAAAIEQVSLRRGYAPSDYTLVSFGGAGGQHACALADRLGMRTVLMPQDASLLSAVGLGAAVVERIGERQVLATLDDIAKDLEAMFDQCAEEAVGHVADEGVDRAAIELRRRIVHMRLVGQDSTIAVDVDNLANLVEQFGQRYREMYGTDPPEEPIEVESIRVIASSHADRMDEQPETVVTPFKAEAARTSRARFDREWRKVPVFVRSTLSPGATVAGPALIFDQRSAYVIETGWTASIDDARAIVARKDVERPSAPLTATASGASELVQLELFTNQLSAIAQEMGEILQRTALSTNVKRRRDFSCGVLDANGELLVNAPHIPVHLGALGFCVRAVMTTLDLEPGDVAVTNHPAFGGSHLPDITVITPVHTADRKLLGYVASRAHHAEVGGMRPGSMPATARSLAEEGVVISPMHLVQRGESRFDTIAGVLQLGDYPSRAVRENIADLRAAVAANHRGAVRFIELFNSFGHARAGELVAQLKERAARLARMAITELPQHQAAAMERLDDGSQLWVAIERSGEHATIDFAGTSPQHEGNLNGTPAIVRSAVLYVLRAMIGERLPLNEGIMDAVRIRLPRCLLNPEFPVDAREAPAVVGGNTETSQRLVDTLFKALGACACSQGTMNNLVFGTDQFSYYETICGGAGAGPGFDGASAVHTHMTNTRITDPETLEHRYPVRLERFAIRAGSGGRGAHRGGDGVVREIVFLESMELSVLTQHRVERPYGANGGEDGQPGRQYIVRASGEIIALGSVDQCEIGPGDRLVIETPGGGGFGSVHWR